MLSEEEIFARIAACDGFEWDAGNLFKAWMGHRVLPDECHEAFANWPRLAGVDEMHSGKEPRFLFYGRTNRGRFLMIVFTFRGNKIRVISPRDMSKRERTRYNEANTRHSGV